MSVRPSVACTAFGQLPDGRLIEVFTLANGRGLEAEILGYGGIVRALRVPDARGTVGDIVLGFDSLSSYVGPHPYFGGIIGRYGNRIARGRFRLDDRSYELTRNNGSNHLHGGAVGFDRVPWSAEATANEEAASVTLRRVSPDGEEGYPGTLSCTATYTLSVANEFGIEYQASTDRTTIVNLTHHSYFDLSAGSATSIAEHDLSVAASHFLPVDDTLIPLGGPSSVVGTPFDLRTAARLGSRIDSEHPQIRLGRGFDHNFVLDGWSGGADASLRPAARLTDPKSGRSMSVLTTEPGLQIYTGGFLDGTIEGKGGRRYSAHAGICLETQHFPDSPNRPDFPSARLDPGATYRTTTVYRFETANRESTRG